jgi:hypothetical protein
MLARLNTFVIALSPHQTNPYPGSVAFLLVINSPVFVANNNVSPEYLHQSLVTFGDSLT